MTTIAPAIPSQVPQFVFYLGSQATPEAISATSSTFEGGFYASLRVGAMQASRIVKWVQESAISRIHEIQMIFNAANALIVVYYAKKIVDKTQNHFQFSVVDLTSAWTFGILPVVLTTGIAFAIGMLITNRLSKDTTANEVYDPAFTISEKMIIQQEIAKALHVTKLVLNIGLACMAKNRFWFLVGLAGSGYSLFKNSSIQWLRFSRGFEIQNQNLPGIRRATITYKMLALKPGSSMVNETCAICLEKPVDMAFCINHVFHKNCMKQLVATKSANFMNGLQIIKQIMPNNQNRTKKCNYFVTVPEQNLPNCPQCRDFPLQNDCDILIHDSTFGNCDARVTIQRQKDNQYQSLFEKFYAAYNIVQVSLAYLQQYPELAAGIYSIQQVMIVTDIFGLLGTAYYLQKQVQEKLHISVGGLRETMYRVAAVATFVAMGALSFFVALQINTYLQSALVLKDILAQLEISPDILKTIDVQWASATILQSLYLMRMTMSVALGFFSKQRLLSLWNVAAQAFSFTAISRLKWIVFSQTLTDYPLRKAFAEGGTHTLNLDEWSLSDLTVKSEFLVSSSCTKETHHVKSVLKSIYGCMSKLLDKSSWDRYLETIYTSNGVKISRKIYYSVNLQNNPVLPCDCTLIPSLTRLSMSGRDAWYGPANFNIQQ